MFDLHLRGNFRHGSHAVVLWECVVVKDHPLGQPQLVRLGSVAGFRVQVGHMFVRQNQVVSSSVHVPGDLAADRRRCHAVQFSWRWIQRSPPPTCMKKPANRALFRLRLLVLVPNEGSEMGSSILFRVSVSSERTTSAVLSEEYDRKLSWHHFSALVASKVKTQKKRDGQKNTLWNHNFWEMNLNSPIKKIKMVSRCRNSSWQRGDLSVLSMTSQRDSELCPSFHLFAKQTGIKMDFRSIQTLLRERPE